jgi:ketosteroid isomerase-like protein
MPEQNAKIVSQLLGPFTQQDIVPLFRDEAISASITAASAPLLTADFECVFVREDLGRAAYHGSDGLRAGWLDRFRRGTAIAPRSSSCEVGEDRVLVLVRDNARPKGSDAEVYFTGATLWTVRDDKIARVEFYWDRADAHRAVGMED